LLCEVAEPDPDRGHVEGSPVDEVTLFVVPRGAEHCPRAETETFS
jgi:hypothetical protein